MPRLVCILVLLAAGCAPRAVIPNSLSEDAKRLLEVIGEFDVADTTGLPFVRISRGGYETKFGPVVSTTSYGFLERRSGPAVHLRMVHMMRERLIPRPEGAPPEPRPGCEKLDLADFVRERLGGGEEDRFPFPSVDEEHIFHERLVDAILARDCYRRGLREEGDALIARAMKEDSDWRERRLAEGLNRLLILRFRDPNLTRRDLITQHLRWFELFPQSELRWEVQSRTQELAESIAEEDSSGEKDLVSSLRDEFDPVFPASGDLDYLPALSPQVRTPALDLIRLGTRAVPRLIAALNDSRLTRVVICDTDQAGSLEVMTVGGMAHAILMKISGLVHEGDTAFWNRWLADVNAMGEEGVMARAVAGDDPGRSVDLYDFLKRWPHRVDAVVRWSTRSGGTRGNRLIVSGPQRRF